MKKSTAIGIVLVTHLAVAFAAEEAAPGWTVLFDGRSTAAWRGWDSEQFPAHGWVIEDGCLRCLKSNGRGNGGGGDLITRQQFTDFDLRWEWKVSPGGNSGVKYYLVRRTAPFRSMFKDDDGRSLVGLEYQLLDDARHPDALEGPIRQTAAVYLLFPSTNKMCRPAGQWNQSRIVVQGNHVEHWLNESRVAEFELGSAALAQAIAASKYKSVPGFGKKVPTPILLQDHGDDIWFRNIRIRDLSKFPAK